MWSVTHIISSMIRIVRLSWIGKVGNGIGVTGKGNAVGCWGVMEGW